MQTMTNDLVDLPRGKLLAQAREVLLRQAVEIYDAEALSHVEKVFARNTVIMTDEQLVHIVRRGA